MILSFSRTSLKFLEKREQKTSAAILEAIGELPDKGDIQKLKGQSIKNAFYLRLGRYRIVYDWEDPTMRILRIDSGGDVYK